MNPRSRGLILAAVISLSTAAQIFIAHRYFGFVGGDDVEILASAFDVATDRHSESWDIRNLFVPHFVVAPVLVAARRLGVTGTRTLIEIATLPFILLTALTTWLVDRLALRWTGDANAGLVAAMVFAFHWLPLAYGSTVYPRTIATFCVVAAALLLSSDGYGRALAAGALAGLAFTDRFSEIVFLLPLLVLAGRRAWLVVVGTLMMIAVTVGVYDAFTWGHPFSSFVKFARLTLLEPDFSSRIKMQSPLFYLLTLPRWLALTAVPFLFMTKSAGGPVRRAFVFVLVPLVALSFVRHKEVRYLQGVIPFLAIAIGAGYVSLAQKRRVLAMTLLLATFVWQLNGLKMVGKKSMPAVMAAEDISRDPAMHFVLFSQNWAYGANLFLRDDLRMDDLGAPPQLQRLRTLGVQADAVALYESDLNTEWRRTFRRLGFAASRVYRDDPARAVVVFRRVSGSASGTSDRARQ